MTTLKFDPDARIWDLYGDRPGPAGSVAIELAGEVHLEFDRLEPSRIISASVPALDSDGSVSTEAGQVLYDLFRLSSDALVAPTATLADALPSKLGTAGRLAHLLSARTDRGDKPSDPSLWAVEAVALADQVGAAAESILEIEAQGAASGIRLVVELSTSLADGNMTELFAPTAGALIRRGWELPGPFADSVLFDDIAKTLTDVSAEAARIAFRHDLALAGFPRPTVHLDETVGNDMHIGSDLPLGALREAEYRFRASDGHLVVICKVGSRPIRSPLFVVVARPDADTWNGWANEAVARLAVGDHGALTAELTVPEGFDGSEWSVVVTSTPDVPLWPRSSWRRFEALRLARLATDATRIGSQEAATLWGRAMEVYTGLGDEVSASKAREIRAEAELRPTSQSLPTPFLPEVLHDSLGEIVEATAEQAQRQLTGNSPIEAALAADLAARGFDLLERTVDAADVRLVQLEALLKAGKPEEAGDLISRIRSALSFAAHRRGLTRLESLEGSVGTTEGADPS